MTQLDNLCGVALVKIGNAVAFEAAGGMADKDSGAANAADTRFQLASISKQFTAAAIMLLADRGVLDVHDPVRKWIDNCPQSWHDITLHHLLTHTSGIGHWADMPEIDICARMDFADQLSIIQGHELRSAPGLQYYYSSLGYFLLGHVARRAAEAEYATFLSDQIFTPLGMQHTFQGNGKGQSHLAVGYADGAVVRSFELDTTNVGAGDVWSTVGDMAIWDAAVAKRALLSASSWDATLSAQVKVDEDSDGQIRTDGYGYGWTTGAFSGHRTYYHTGGNAGFRTINCWMPSLDTTVVILTNDEATDMAALVGDVLASALK